MLDTKPDFRKTHKFLLQTIRRKYGTFSTFMKLTELALRGTEGSARQNISFTT